MVEKLLKDWYGLTVSKVEKSAAGAGSDTYFVTGSGQNYVLKFPCESEINHPEAEPLLCDFLRKQGIPVSEFVPNRLGEFLSRDQNGRQFHLQKFVEGKMYDWHTAPQWLLWESARTLGKIHRALSGYQGLPEGIGKGFFAYMTPQRAKESYLATRELARARGDQEIEEDLTYRIGLMDRFLEYRIDLDRLTCQATHGDYFISQWICGEDRINGVMDHRLRTPHCVGAHPLLRVCGAQLQGRGDPDPGISGIRFPVSGIHGVKRL